MLRSKERRLCWILCKSYRIYDARVKYLQHIWDDFDYSDSEKKALKEISISANNAEAS